VRYGVQCYMHTNKFFLMKLNTLVKVSIILSLTGCHNIFFCTNKNIASRNIPSMADYWASPEKSSKPKDTTMRNWVECGGTGNGWYRMPLHPYDLNITSEEIVAASRQKVEQIERCMLSKGYRYTGRCDRKVIGNSIACREGI